MAAGSFADSHRLEFPTGDIGERADGCGHDGREIKSAAATVGSTPGRDRVEDQSSQLRVKTGARQCVSRRREHSTAIRMLCKLKIPRPPVFGKRRPSSGWRGNTDNA